MHRGFVGSATYLLFPARIVHTVTDEARRYALWSFRSPPENRPRSILGIPNPAVR